MKTRVPLKVHVTNRQRAVKVTAARLREAAIQAARCAGSPAGAVSVVAVGDRAMRALNRRFTGVDDTTDVLAFDLRGGSAGDAHAVAGEVVVNAALAASRAARRRREAEHELLLYVVHGMLHLAGYGDKTAAEARAMRKAERAVMRRLRHRRTAAGGGRRND